MIKAIRAIHHPLVSTSALVRISVAVRRRHADIYKGKHFFGAALQFRVLVHNSHGGMKADMVLEKDLNLDLKAAEVTVTQ